MMQTKRFKFLSTFRRTKEPRLRLASLATIALMSLTLQSILATNAHARGAGSCEDVLRQRSSWYPIKWKPHLLANASKKVKAAQMQVAEVLEDPFVLEATGSDVFREYILAQKNGKLEDYKELADAEPRYTIKQGPSYILDSNGKPILDPTLLSSAQMMEYLLRNYKLPDATVMNQAYFSAAEKKANHPLLKVMQRQGMIAKDVDLQSGDLQGLIAQALRHIHNQWEVLLRENKTQGRNTLLPMPKPYVVAGGRFREAYFWDSYWIMKGLLESGYGETAKGMLENFISLYETQGIIPNGNREYYLTRTQLPVLMEMVTLLENNGLLNFNRMKNINISARDKKRSLEGRILNATEQYYKKIWKESSRYKSEFGLATFGDDAGGDLDHEAIVIRPESAAREPRITEKHSQRVFAESGWDMSYSRFGKRPQDWFPVDLNMTLMGYAKKLAIINAKAGNPSSATYFEAEAQRIKVQMDAYLFDSSTGLYVDYNFVERRLSTVITAASFFPFYFEAYSRDPQHLAKAQRILGTLLKTLKPEGHLGIHTTNQEGPGQWDGAWTWAPLVEMSFQGLLKYGMVTQARKVAFDYCLMTVTAFHENGFFSEKYIGKDGSIKIPEGSEIYGNETGFGWTNGTVALFLRFLAEQGDLPALERAIQKRLAETAVRN